jgi:O-antigen ligase
MEMTICLPLGLLFVGAIGKDRRLLYITAVALMGVALLLSGSRGGLVALLAAVFFLVILTTRTKNYSQLVLKIGLAVLLIATIVVGSILIGGESSLTRIAESANSQDFSTSRTHIWSVTLRIILNNLPFGAGLGAFAVAYTPYDTLNGLERVEQAHNDYLEVLASAGIVGLIIGGLFIYLLFNTGLKNLKTSNTFRRGVCVGALAGCFAILVHSIFDFVLHTTAISILFLMLASLVAISGYKFSDDAGGFESKSSKKKRPASVTPIEKGRRIKS